MIKKETVLYFADDKDDKLFLSGIYDNYKRTVEKGITTFSAFMSERKSSLLRAAFASDNEAVLSFFGGYDGAERTIACFSPNGDIRKDYPVLILNAEVKGEKVLSHRDFLGALMSLGIKREIVGDIITGGKYRIVVLRELADYIILNLDKVGSASIKLSICEETSISDDKKEEFLRVTVASMRLDGIVSAAFNLSRDKSQKLIASGKVCVDSRPEISNDCQIKCKSIVSARGYGRITIDEIKGTSKKGRTVLKIIK